MVAVRDLLGIALQDHQLGRCAALAVIRRVEPLALEADLQANVAEPALFRDVDHGAAAEALHDDEGEQRLEDDHGLRDDLRADG